MGSFLLGHKSSGLHTDPLGNTWVKTERLLEGEPRAQDTTEGIRLPNQMSFP